MLNLWLAKQAKKYGDKEAIVFDDFDSGKKWRVSYRQLNSLTANLAVYLRHLGLAPGQRLAFAFENSLEVILINLAAWRAGLVTVPLDITRDTPERKAYKLKFTETEVLFTRKDEKSVQENRWLKSRLKNLEVIELADFSELKARLVKSDSSPDFQTDPDRDALILFTSGTTALPKGARLTLNNLWANAQSIVDWLRFGQRDRWQVVLPLHHINSTTFVNTALMAGGTVVLLPRYSKSRFWQALAENRVTGTSIVPTIAYDMLSEEKAFLKYKSKLKQVRRIQIGSAPVQPTVVEEFMAKFKIPLIQGYGQTETSLRSTGVPMALTASQYKKIRQLNSLGTELKHTQVTVLDRAGREVGEGKVGEIVVRGPVVMKGYLKNPAANKEAFQFGWFHSGDTGYWRRLFGRKFFFLKGRTKEIIHKGGVLVSPLAVENALLKAYPTLKQVYAVGFPDARMGERIGLVAVAKNEKTLAKILADAAAGKVAGLSRYEAPSALVAIDESNLPKTSTGKVQRIKLKEKFAVKLLERSRTITESDQYRFKLLGPEETSLLRQALAINNQRWGKKLNSNLAEFRKRAENGLLLAAIDKKSHRVVGSVAALQLNKQLLPPTWRKATAAGTLKNHDYKGDSLVCVSISAAQTRDSKPVTRNSLKIQKTKLTPAKLKVYLTSDKDNIVRFHRKPKGGFGRGARLIKVLPGGRLEDQDSLGYNIVFEYPKLTHRPRMSQQASIGVQLIEAALIYAYEHKIKHVLAYSRPAELSKYFKKG
ncbi:MAG: AMP-dependent synthetase and ligase [Candidatus Beckwithbacteria bacterium GW2011_GWB1_47_15]|uniref:AMP-dependent synthetase and ligase n=1 Tax=Candidatus Beckwithbacteria bacterium GW2011_GWB1_47_15 TaxID=1618371 RepID=A0A0G1RXG6_9BACT|nr:MAG: acyl-CoA synthetase/AMP-acid ligase II [Candidatus Beckwithbacteria bacterium GW2011_GWC1_49_16]AQS30655.1 hypothetical protein [uncultured bacterium]KKU35843.1 MAG: AMP-dependent synthetase and ligase [Candidatus Beckwithbacteria bacterium GW2011_GWA1_46_30]KKU61807.1 MAG: AMP-dependent synthetase and ligase [Candidatus Beckwithbacteria bacterium GW2011_GWB1_47_15]KKU72639.1 MAG: AMP-dependent synthetase and ligase [Candidatus Beckwithbacteria bacterium GW2011_GWA2_47_25]KKW04192.1 MA